MAKKTAEKKPVTKKPRRRLKRTARRSLAAVLMITAVVVAAIPVPENVAAPGDDVGDTEITEVVYAYDTTQYSENNFGVKLSPEKPEDVHQTHYIFLDGGSYRMEWQYEFFLKMVNGQSKGIICGYNDAYPVELLKVDTDPIFDFYTVWDQKRSNGSYNENTLTRTENQPSLSFEEFKAKAETPGDRYCEEFSCGADPDVELYPEDARFAKFFPEEFAAQVNRANKYKTEKEAWDKKVDDWKKANTGWTQELFDAWKVDNPEPPKVAPITGWTPAKFPTEPEDAYEWRLYYCDKMGMKDYILVRVADSERTTKLGSEVTIYSYVPQRIDLKDKTEDDDENGFRIANKTSFIGIGDKAFASKAEGEPAVENVKSIELPDAIKYIGDSAFEGSFIDSIRMVNVANVGNYAFKNCPMLSSVEFVQGVNNIGKEAFYGIQNLKSIAFPGTVTYIGPAAFAECSSLTDVDFSKLSLSLAIDDYAFYNDIALNKVDFVKAGTKDTTVSVTGLGKGAFAVQSSVRGNLTDFVIPQGIKSNEDIGGLTGGMGVGGEGLGDYLLAGRTNLLHVTMSENYGSSSAITLPDDLFFNCISLEWVKFPSTGNSCGFVRYNDDLFDTVGNPNFYVEGPKYLSPSNKVPAYPRESTWDAYSAVSDTIPYVYWENGVRYVEVSDGIYLECIDDKGVLISCTLKPKAAIPADGIDLVIPAEVAGITVTGIGTGCFSDDTLNQAVKTLTILDGSKLETINDGVFSGWKNLQKAYIGDSVRNVGKDVFLDDTKLIDITFNTPESAAGQFKVGANAFKTNGLELTFHGIINGNYAPYLWAIDAGNVIDSDKGIRVCYKSLAPTSLTVMYDSSTKQVTLLDYPKYADAGEILGESYATKKGVNWKKWKKLDGKLASSAADFYKDWMERDYYSKYSSDQFDPYRDRFATAWSAAADPEEVYNNYDVYGPWVTPEYCATFGSTTPTPDPNPDSGTDPTPDPDPDEGDGAKATFDWLFEPITAYAAPGRPQPYFTIHSYNIYENYERSGSDAAGQYQTQTMDENDVFDATKNVVVPDGVTSIDVKGFIDAAENSGNVATYLTVGKLGDKTAEMYRVSKGSGNNFMHRENDVVGGLFSGGYDDYDGTGDDDTHENEVLKKGNDRLESIDLNGVTYLPQYAFDSCENLKKVMIGKACTNIGTLPFRGCTALTNVEISADNPKYLVEKDIDSTCKRIIYSRNGNAENGDNLYKIEECLETRGKNTNNSVVDSAFDTLISGVNEIADGAFAACEFVEDVYLTDATHLTEIPKRCFLDCAKLNTVQLPSSVNKIEEYAFYNADVLSTLRIPGREVSFTDYVFEDNNKNRTDVITYEDSAARRYADTNADKYNLRWVNIGDVWEVKFYDMDGIQIGNTISVEDSTRLKKEQIPPDPVREGYVFDTWIGTGGITVDDYITGPTNFIAKYNFNSNGAPVDGKYVVEFHDGVTGEQLAGRGSNPDDGKYYVPVGTSFEDNGWPEPSHLLQAGYEPAGFSSGNGSAGQWTAKTVVNSNLSIIALYKVSTTSGGSTNTPGGNTNTSGNTTNTSGNTTNNNNSSSSRSTSSTTTSSSTSSSSTSTSSSTSDGAGKYAVFVENGSGSGYFSPGETVIIQAATPAAGMKFSNWTTDSNGVTLASASMAATTFTMPSNNVTVKANFVEDTGTTSAPRATSTGNTTDRDTGNTRVDIEKPGISNRDLATANVNGSTDNFIVKISETDEATRAVAAALTNKYGTLDNILYYAMDITLWDATGSYQLTGDQLNGISVDITIPIPDSLVAYGGNNKAGAVINSDQLESLNENFTTINGVPCIRFRATHFSPYTIYVDTGNLVEGMLDTTPKTGDPIHPKWFLSLGLACLSIILFMKKDKRVAAKATVKA